MRPGQQAVPLRDLSGVAGVLLVGGPPSIVQWVVPGSPPTYALVMAFLFSAGLGWLWYQVERLLRQCSPEAGDADASRSPEER